MRGWTLQSDKHRKSLAYRNFDIIVDAIQKHFTRMAE